MLLPVPADPTLEVKLSRALFDSLDQLYAPRFIVQRNFEPGCAPPRRQNSQRMVP